MSLHLCRAAAMLALACGGFGAAQAQSADLEVAADRTSIQPGRSLARDEWMPQGANRSMELLPRHGLAKGVFMRKPLSDNANLTLRLRSGRIGLYLNVQMPVRD